MWCRQCFAQGIHLLRRPLLLLLSFRPSLHALRAAGEIGRKGCCKLVPEASLGCCNRHFLKPLDAMQAHQWIWGSALCQWSHGLLCRKWGDFQQQSLTASHCLLWQAGPPLVCKRKAHCLRHCQCSWRCTWECGSHSVCPKRWEARGCIRHAEDSRIRGWTGRNAAGRHLQPSSHPRLHIIFRRIGWMWQI